MSNNQASRLLKTIYETTDLIGVEPVVKLMEDAKKSHSLNHSELTNKELEKEILKIVSRKYEFSVEKLKTGRNHGLLMEAITVCCVCFCKYLGYSSDQASAIFGRDGSNIRKRITGFNKLNSNDKLENKILDRANKVFERVENLINNR